MYKTYWDFPVLYYVSQGLVESLEDESLALDPNIRVIALYDNEEVSYLVTLNAVRIIQTADQTCYIMQLMTLSNGSLIIGHAVILEVKYTSSSKLCTLWFIVAWLLHAFVPLFCFVKAKLWTVQLLCLKHWVSFMGEGDTWILNSTLIGFILRIFDCALAWLALYC